ncbi:hypothetical protein KC19_6G156000 [Ceratodon purpureus]|uniref:Uncharacterized protein n=1 Tax=Ceratodon purpureus TaxID=3225 RepID=A0A8T0HFE2_CERPU|nr:hypothetical protein KC19_6G156000 [Ceratodon purpureus]
MRGLTILAILALACILHTSPALAVTRSPDGLPRPTGYPDTPTMAYGPTPPCYLNSVAVTCEWYGFSYILYPTQGAQCLTTTRRVLTNATLVAPGDLLPYHYYYLDRFVFDTTTNDSYCIYGCFDMSASGGPVPSPPAGFVPASPPTDLATPPPALSLAPPPVDLSTPPPAVPPSVLATPPPTLDSTMPPPDSSTTPPAAAVPPATTTPSPPRPGIINLNNAQFLRPTGLLSFIISGALLLLNGLAGF